MPFCCNSTAITKFARSTGQSSNCWRCVEPWVAWWLQHRTPDRKARVQCPMPPNTLRVHMEYALVKSAAPKVLWTESRMQGTGEYFPPFQSHGEAAVAEWYRYRTVACFVTGSSPVPLKTRRVGQRCTLNLSRAETSSRWCGVVW
ncbi:uncharacterized protein TNCV_2450331 [Trichonephila clavipes]|nr:uncharacterized protein TNCV_2450331 [Trichonephila clavipes]